MAGDLIVTLGLAVVALGSNSELDSASTSLEASIVEEAELVLFTIPSCTKLALKSTVFKEASSGK